VISRRRIGEIVDGGVVLITPPRQRRRGGESVERRTQHRQRYAASMAHVSTGRGARPSRPRS
jgi:hypothetical protein